MILNAASLPPIVASDVVDCASTRVYPSSGVYRWGTNAVTLTAHDSLGTTATCNMNINVYDPYPPTITCPFPPPQGSPYYVLPTDKGLPTASFGTCVMPSFTFNQSVCPGGATYDNVGLSNLYGVAVDTRAPLTTAALGLGLHTLLFTDVDLDSNTATCFTSIFVKDLEPPTLTCPQSLDLPENATGLYSFIPFSLLATDNIALHSVSIAVAGNASNVFNSSSTVYNTSTIATFAQNYIIALESGLTITFNLSAIDIYNNTASCAFTYNVIRSPITKSLLSLTANASSTASTVATVLVAVTQQAANFTPFQVTLGATLVTTLVSNPNVSSQVVFQSLDNFGSLTPTAIATAQTLDNSASKIRDAALSIAQTLAQSLVQTSINASAATHQNTTQQVQTVNKREWCFSACGCA